MVDTFRLGCGKDSALRRALIFSGTDDEQTRISYEADLEEAGFKVHCNELASMDAILSKSISQIKVSPPLVQLYLNFQFLTLAWQVTKDYYWSLFLHRLRRPSSKPYQNLQSSSTEKLSLWGYFSATSSAPYAPRSLRNQRFSFFWIQISNVYLLTAPS